MGFFTPETASPESALEVILLPLLFLVFGIILYSASNRFLEMEGSRPKWMPLVWILFGLAILFGLQRLSFLSDLLYANTVTTRKLRLAHQFGFFGPLLSLVAVGLNEWRRKKVAANRLY